MSDEQKGIRIMFISMKMDVRKWKLVCPNGHIQEIDKTTIDTGGCKCWTIKCSKCEEVGTYNCDLEEFEA